MCPTLLYKNAAKCPALSLPAGRQGKSRLSVKPHPVGGVLHIIPEVVIPTKAGNQFKNIGFRVKPGMTKTK
jgi:hypothetical protein